MYEVIRWIVSGLLGMAFLVVAAFNWWTVLRRSVDGPSTAPLLGGALGVASLCVCPLEGSKWYLWIPLLADYGSIPYFVLVVREVFRTQKRS